MIDSIPPMPRKEAEHRKGKRWVSWEDQQEIIRHLPATERPLFMFLACHGKRLSEGLALRWERFDFKKQAVLAQEQKVKKERWLALHPEFLRVLPPVPIRKEGLVFDCTKERARRLLAQACRECGLPELGSHEFGRHGFVQQRVDNGFSDAEINSVTNNLSPIKGYAESHLSLQKNCSSTPP